MQLTKNFNLAEFDCKDGTPVPKKFYSNVLKLAQNLQVLRDYLNAPVLITGSGYRTPAHNKKVGGAKESQHLTASGGDINVPGFTPQKLATVIEKLISEGRMVQGGLGIYPGFVHYDIRGTKARW
jgi:uncharacterized protein YcbK (DUF882 family)